MWPSGRALVYYDPGPDFDPQHPGCTSTQMGRTLNYTKNVALCALQGVGEIEKGKEQCML